jgi:HEAT repeat protein
VLLANPNADESSDGLLGIASAQVEIGDAQGAASWISTVESSDRRRSLYLRMADALIAQALTGRGEGIVRIDPAKLGAADAAPVAEVAPAGPDGPVVRGKSMKQWFEVLRAASEIMTVERLRGASDNRARAENDVNDASAALASIGKPAVPGLVTMLKDAGASRKNEIGPRFVGEAGRALIRIGSPAVPELINFVKSNPKDPATPDALETLRLIGQPAVAPAIELLKHDDAEVRTHAAKVLLNTAQYAQSAVPALTAATKDKDANVRAMAAQALQQVSREAGSSAKPSAVATAGVGALGEALSDPDEHVRANAASSLGSQEPAALAPIVPQMAAALDKAVADKQGGQNIAYIKTALLKALAKAGPASAPALPTLVRSISKASPDEVSAAIGAIGEKAVPTIRELLGKGSAERKIAIGAVSRMCQDPNPPPLRPGLPEAPPPAGVVQIAPDLFPLVDDPDTHQYIRFPLSLASKEITPTVQKMIEGADPIARRRALVIAAWITEDRNSNLTGEPNPKAKAMLPVVFKSWSQNADTRPQATRALMAMGGSDLISKQLKSPKPADRAAAAEALGMVFGKYGSKADRPTMEMLASALEDKDPSVRAAALRSLSKGDQGLSDVRKKVVELLADSDPGVRKAAAELCWKKPNYFNAKDALIKAADDPDAGTAIAAIKGLRENREIAGAALGKLMLRSDSAARLEALPLAKDIFSTETWPGIFAAISDPDPRVKRAAVVALEDSVGRTGFDKVLDQAKAVVTPLARDPDALVRAQAYLALARLASWNGRSGPIPPELTAGLQDTDPRARAAAALVIGKGQRESMIADALKTPDPAVRAQVYELVLSKARDDAERGKWFTQAARDTDNGVREVATRDALRPNAADFFRSEQEALAALAEILAKPPASLQLQAARAIGRLGPWGRGVIPQLKDAAKTSADPAVRSMAMRALSAIENNQPMTDEN